MAVAALEEIACLWPNVGSLGGLYATLWIAKWGNKEGIFFEGTNILFYELLFYEQIQIKFWVHFILVDLHICCKMVCEQASLGLILQHKVGCFVSKPLWKIPSLQILRLTLWIAKQGNKEGFNFMKTFKSVFEGKSANMFEDEL